MNIPEGWKLVPVEPTPAMVEAAFDALPNSPLEGRIRTHYRHMLAAAPNPPAQDDETLVLTERQRSIVSLALWNFINAAYSQATYYAQNGPVEHVSKFQDDARGAEEIRALLTKRGTA